MKQNDVKKFFEKIKYVFSSINQDIKQRYENEIELERVWREHTQKKTTSYLFPNASILFCQLKE